MLPTPTIRPQTLALLLSLSLLGIAQAQAENLPAVMVATLNEQPLEPEFDLVGRVEAQERVELLARVSGFLEERLFTEGGTVQAGAALFQIERRPYEIQLKQAKADLAAAKAVLKNAEAELSRNRTLRKQGAVSVAQFDQAEASRDQAKAQVMQAEAGVENAELNLSYTRVQSPIEGRIGKANFSQGNLVGPNSGPLATIVKLDPIYVEVSISEKVMIDARRQGIDIENPPVAPILILSDGSDYEHRGDFVFINPEVDRSTDTLRIRAVFPNPDGILLPGEFVQVRIQNKIPQQALMVPQSAVQKNQQGYFVLVVDNTNKVNQRPVELGQQIRGLWQVQLGLSAGERVIVEGLQKVQPGIEVRAQEAGK